MGIAVEGGALIAGRVVRGSGIFAEGEKGKNERREDVKHGRPGRVRGGVWLCIGNGYTNHAPLRSANASILARVSAKAFCTASILGNIRMKKLKIRFR